MDLYSRKVINCFSDKPTCELTTRALRFSELAWRSVSTNRTENFFDNGVAEHFLRNLNSERINTRRNKTRPEAMADIIYNIEPLYNKNGDIIN